MASKDTSSTPRVLALVLLGVIAVMFWLAGCASSPRQFSTAPVLWTDDDRRPFPEKPGSTWSPLYWDGADHMLFRPVSHAFLLETAHEAVNVNAFDEVPDSSWFVNRLSRSRMSAEEIARGPCTHGAPELDLPWTVVGAKMDGNNPGFRIRTASGRVVYVIKFDSPDQWERASAADVVGSRLYYAAGFQVPCNRVVYFRPEAMEMPDRPINGPDGKPLDRAAIQGMVAQLPRESDGTLRALASEFLPGKPIGPWTYSGTWDEDPNDVVPHEARREIRGSRLLAAWIQHHDARAQNTLAMWSEDGGGRGHVEHYLIDWGDTLGGLTQWDSVSRRVGYAYYVDFEYMAADFFTFGAIERPWERAHFGPAGKTLGYFDDAEFDAEQWHVGYPNPAFSAMRETDGAWMARIVARFDDATIAAVVREGRLSSPIVRSELERILRGRRDKVLRRYLLRLSSLTEVHMEDRVLCARDRAEETGLGPAPGPSARIWFSETTVAGLRLERRADGQICITVPRLATAQSQWIVDLSTGRPGQGPLRVHLQDGSAPRVVGIERLDASAVAL